MRETDAKTGVEKSEAASAQRGESVWVSVSFLVCFSNPFCEVTFKSVGESDRRTVRIPKQTLLGNLTMCPSHCTQIGLGP